MQEKKKKKKKNELCILCNCETNDFYKVATNKGYVTKCANCYELWILRSSRRSHPQSQKEDQMFEDMRSSK